MQEEYYGPTKMTKNNAYTLLVVATCLMMLVAVGLVFLYAPVEASMGVVQKIFYFHVPSAYTMYLSWGTCTIASILYLVKRTDNWDMVAKSAAEMALVFAAIVMTTGPIWGRKSWGAYWTWDPRLTTSLLLTLIILSYVLLRAFSSGEAERRFAAALAILGACIIPLIHLSVQKWRGQHPTVITGKGGGLAPSMKIVFALCMVTFTLFFATLLIRRYKLEKNKRRLEALKEEAAAQGITKGAY
ncbi:MAG: cytochrome c biogenesis protein CcsA [Proteobacteria bacterium]|nr:cytochrome c biogenesis protein CcsA [Pseudomonadota bacterium]